MTEYVFTISFANYIHTCSLMFVLEFQFLHEEALACELAAYFYLQMGDAKKAVDYCLLSHEKYEEWVSTSR